MEIFIVFRSLLRKYLKVDEDPLLWRKNYPVLIGHTILVVASQPRSIEWIIKLNEGRRPKAAVSPLLWNTIE